MPLVETPGALSLFVGGCELRLVPGDDDVRIELAAPEARLAGCLQDSAMDLFAEAGAGGLFQTAGIRRAPATSPVALAKAVKAASALGRGGSPETKKGRDCTGAMARSRSSDQP